MDCRYKDCPRYIQIYRQLRWKSIACILILRDLVVWILKDHLNTTEPMGELKLDPKTNKFSCSPMIYDYKTREKKFRSIISHNMGWAEYKMDALIATEEFFERII